MTDSPQAVTRYPALSRWLHWSMALLIIGLVFVGVAMVDSVATWQPTAVQLHKWLAQETKDLKLTLDPWTSDSIKTIAGSQTIRLVIGPEGGFSDHEVAQTSNAGFVAVQLGPRVLRTETAALTAISALQLQMGDLA